MRTRPTTLRALPAVLVALAGVATLLVSGCSVSGAKATNNGSYVDGAGVVQIAPSDRVTVPTLAGDLVGGGHASLAAAKGKVVVLNLWASWCSPCREEAPALAEAARHLPDAVFYGINTRDTAANAEAFTRARRTPYPSFEDQDGSMMLDLRKAVPSQALPITVVLDKQGRVAAAVLGPTTAITLEELVRPLVRET